VRDLTEYMTFPFDGPIHPRTLDPPVDTEPPRAGEGGQDCSVCDAGDDDFVWCDDDWRLQVFEPSPFLGVMLLTPRIHVETVADLPPRLAADLGPMIGRVEQAIYSLGGVGRVHLNLWGDGGAHLHLWFYPRPYGQLQLRGTFLAVWSLVLPDRPIEETRQAAEQVAAAMDADAAG